MDAATVAFDALFDRALRQPTSERGREYLTRLEPTALRSAVNILCKRLDCTRTEECEVHAWVQSVEHLNALHSLTTTCGGDFNGERFVDAPAAREAILALARA